MAEDCKALREQGRLYSRQWETADLQSTVLQNDHDFVESLQGMTQLSQPDRTRLQAIDREAVEDFQARMAGLNESKANWLMKRTEANALVRQISKQDADHVKQIKKLRSQGDEVVESFCIPDIPMVTHRGQAIIWKDWFDLCMEPEKITWNKVNTLFLESEKCYPRGAQDPTDAARGEMVYQTANHARQLAQNTGANVSKLAMAKIVMNLFNPEHRKKVELIYAGFTDKLANKETLEKVKAMCNCAPFQTKVGAKNGGQNGKPQNNNGGQGQPLSKRQKQKLKKQNAGQNGGQAHQNQGQNQGQKGQGQGQGKQKQNQGQGQSQARNAGGGRERCGYCNKQGHARVNCREYKNDVLAIMKISKQSVTTQNNA